MSETITNETNSKTVLLSTTSERLHGRRKILSDYLEVTEDNIIEILCKALNVHMQNRAEIEYLYNYRKGIQPSLFRTKQVRPEICSHIVENRAAQIVDFKTGYMCGSSNAIQYIGSCSQDGRQEELAGLISQLNEYMQDIDASTENKEIFDWVFTCGVAYKMVLPNVQAEYGDVHTTPFESYVLDPRNTFVVYSNALGEPALMGVRYVKKENGTVIYSCYTKDCVYTVELFKVKKKEQYRILNSQGHIVENIPIVEYIDSEMRMGSFEVVITMLDAINNVEANRQEAVEQYVQALLLMHNVGLNADEYDALREQGCIQFDDVSPDKTADISYISLDLDQGNTQTLVSNMWQTVREICGVPSMSNGETSDSSNNGAVLMRQGWGQAEAKAKSSEEMFKLSERKYLKLVLNICKYNTGVLKNLYPQDIQIRFTRRNYEDIQTKSQVLVTMLNNDKIDPKLAFEHSGLFVDTERAYLQSMKYYEETQKKASEQQLMQLALQQQSSTTDKENAEGTTENGSKTSQNAQEWHSKNQSNEGGGFNPWNGESFKKGTE